MPGLLKKFPSNYKFDRSTDMPDPVSETSKATQAIAKTANTAIEAARATGAFFAKVLGKPIDTASEIVNDALRYYRWERQVRFVDRAQKFLDERAVKNTNAVPIRLALPLYENGTIEEDDTLQDLWAALLVNAMDPDGTATHRAFIDILRQLEPLDAQLLQLSYDKSIVTIRTPTTRPGWNAQFFPLAHPVKVIELMAELHSKFDATVVAIDNLMRVQCMSTYIKSHDIGVIGESFEQSRALTVSELNYYETVTITRLGIAFVEALKGGKRGLTNR